MHPSRRSRRGSHGEDVVGGTACDVRAMPTLADVLPDLRRDGVSYAVEAKFVVTGSEAALSVPAVSLPALLRGPEGRYGAFCLERVVCALGPVTYAEDDSFGFRARSALLAGFHGDLMQALWDGLTVSIRQGVEVRLGPLCQWSPMPTSVVAGRGGLHCGYTLPHTVVLEFGAREAAQVVLEVHQPVRVALDPTLLTPQGTRIRVRVACVLYGRWLEPVQGCASWTFAQVLRAEAVELRKAVMKAIDLRIRLSLVEAWLWEAHAVAAREAAERALGRIEAGDLLGAEIVLRGARSSLAMVEQLRRGAVDYWEPS